MPISIEEVKKELETRLPDVKLRLVRDSLLIENPEDLPRVALFLKESPKFLLDYLSSVTAADYLTFLESVYHLYSMAQKQGPVVLRARVTKNNARIPSLVPVYRSAELQEREAFDTFGIIYEGHPDPRRLFMWEEFQGYPLRKDYAQEDAEVLEAADVAWLEARGIKVPAEMKEKAKELHAAGQRAVAQKPEKPRN
ncbi:MAG: NADH-quinone oxidoreductase subunit C [Candidatus Omnitrophica bacterium]|nr:NADH-quinone oxidoreductase subunit C [Candidatus Omnitrophota bacterium]